MMKKFLTGLCCLVFIMSVGCNQSKSQQYQPPTIPDFSFKTLNDKPFTRADIKSGKKSMIILFDTSCEHCQHEMKDIGNRFTDFKNVNFYLVSMDGKTEIVKFMESYGKKLYGQKNVTVLTDSLRQFIPTFQPTKFPAMYAYAANGSLIEYFSGQHDVNDIIKAINR
ncbi:redoxin domain-containing protein [Pedobacter sp. HMF7647]|uniref:Redoxin domain-containing protein n=1 Tax=Hufsiella arboris TaxID=2695275 RepID=A0A7K1YAM8_9SPHI|nr:TlpA disulfide reductase family protein [Hufsiella arboris]MXV51118.1 redoxin domain-containing protein [Hufsiella arboris]